MCPTSHVASPVEIPSFLLGTRHDVLRVCKKAMRRVDKTNSLAEFVKDCQMVSINQIPHRIILDDPGAIPVGTAIDALRGPDDPPPNAECANSGIAIHLFAVMKSFTEAVEGYSMDGDYRTRILLPAIDMPWVCISLLGDIGGLTPWDERDQNANRLIFEHLLKLWPEFCKLKRQFFTFCPVSGWIGWGTRYLHLLERLGMPPDQITQVQEADETSAGEMMRKWFEQQ